MSVEPLEYLEFKKSKIDSAATSTNLDYQEPFLPMRSLHSEFNCMRATRPRPAPLPSPKHRNAKFFAPTAERSELHFAARIADSTSRMTTYHGRNSKSFPMSNLSWQIPFIPCETLTL